MSRPGGADGSAPRDRPAVLDVAIEIAALLTAALRPRPGRAPGPVPVGGRGGVATVPPAGARRPSRPAGLPVTALEGGAARPSRPGPGPLAGRAGDPRPPARGRLLRRAPRPAAGVRDAGSGRWGLPRATGGLLPPRPARGAPGGRARGGRPLGALLPPRARRGRGRAGRRHRRGRERRERAVPQRAAARRRRLRPPRRRLRPASGHAVREARPGRGLRRRLLARLSRSTTTPWPSR